MKYWKILVVLVIILLAVIVWSYYQPKTSAPESGSTQDKLVEPTAATGNVDDTVNALLQETTNELMIFQEESEDAALIEIDDRAISDFGQSYDEF